jgi:hypothetical protein
MMGIYPKGGRMDKEFCRIPGSLPRFVSVDARSEEAHAEIRREREEPCHGRPPPICDETIPPTRPPSYLAGHLIFGTAA